MGYPTTLDPSEDLGLPYSNYAPVANPEYDPDATYFETAFCAVAGMSHTAARAWVVVSGAAASAGLMVRDHAAAWGDTDAVKPTLARTATGAYTITWATSYVDLNPTVSRQATVATNLRACHSIANRATAAIITAYMTATGGANVCYVRTYTHAGTAANMRFSVWAY
jgi:hypothetical protein